MQIRYFLGQIRNYNTKVWNNNEFITRIEKFTKHNMKYIDYFELTIRNPKKLIFIDNTIYEGTIRFNKDNMRVIKHFENDNIENLMNEVSDFISREIKI